MVLLFLDHTRGPSFAHMQDFFGIGAIISKHQGVEWSAVCRILSSYFESGHTKKIQNSDKCDLINF